MKNSEDAMFVDKIKNLIWTMKEEKEWKAQ
jgi:hypothetical protein